MIVIAVIIIIRHLLRKDGDAGNLHGYVPIVVNIYFMTRLPSIMIQERDDSVSAPSMDRRKPATQARPVPWGREFALQGINYALMVTGVLA